ncbi:PP2C family protein-serine/threonine phosphatase [Streptomyces panaciradicis]|uniref:PP2C family protein-serine/threonine phosphatase n=1 Tax=Streptomyces panaciradicis TaxID=1470261 RepID=UPI00201CC497|nr:PP2C family protein-serine/threonine phosphatase [Streptomyces panaciradicis]MCL6673994.1 serine/threonine-protein phosphatase [Streptomyces panaciradicis]
MSIPIPLPDVPAVDRRGGHRAREARPRGDFTFCRDLRVVVLSQDEQDAVHVRRLLPDRLVDALIWHTNVDVGWRTSGTHAPLCVLVGSTPAGRTLADVVTRVRRHAPDAAVLVLEGTYAPHAFRSVAGSVQGRADHRRSAPHEFRRKIWVALQRAVAGRTAAGEEIARDNALLERGLLPDPTLQADGFTTAFHYAPGRAHTLLGGDFCDVVRGDDGSAHVVMGDVSGHGATAAALGVHLRLAWRTAVLCGQSQLEQLHLLERILTEERAEEDTYATVVSLVLSPRRRTVRTVTAGHPGFLHRHGNEVRWVEPPPGLPLGLFPGQGDWGESEMAMSDGDGIVLFTDGLYEGRTAGGRLGEEGLLRLAGRLAHLEAQTFVDALVRGVSLLAAPFGGLRDDVAVLHLSSDGEGV